MDGQLLLSEGQCTLVLELLRNEDEELATEIHHTDSREYRVDLLERRRLVEDLIHQLESQKLAHLA